MKKFITNLFLFCIPVIIYCIATGLLIPSLLSLQHGPSTKQQITHSFKNAISREYELLILGNSKPYRGLNPDQFTLPTFNFAHDADSYNQMYYKLRFLFERGKSIKYLILGVDYFQFSHKVDKRNYVYSDFLGDDYIRDFTTGNLLFQKIKYKTKYFISNMHPKNLLLLELKFKNNKPFLCENGQYLYHVAHENGIIERDKNRLDFQIRYFQKIIDLCKSKNIKILIIMPPLRSNELNLYTKSEIEEFDLFIREYTDNNNNNNILYLNYSTSRDFSSEDFADVTHLNESGANKFSKIVDKDLLNLIVEVQ